MSYQDTTFFDSTNTREIAQLEDVTTVNASIAFGADGGNWKVTLGVNNATDEGIPGRRQLVSDDGQRLRRDRVLAAARVFRAVHLRLLSTT